MSCDPKKEYTIKGTFTDEIFDGKEIYLNKYDELGLLNSSDTAIISGHKFRFKGIQEEPAVYYLMMDDESAYGEIALGTPLLVKPGEIVVKVLEDRVWIGGNEENTAYQEYIDTQYPLVEKLFALQEEEGFIEEDVENEENPIKFSPEYVDGLEQMRALTMKYLLDNIDNRLGEEIFISSFQMFDYEDIRKILTHAEESFRYNPVIIEILSQLEAKRNS
jgi:hypothetical protein